DAAAGPLAVPHHRRHFFAAVFFVAFFAAGFAAGRVSDAVFLDRAGALRVFPLGLLRAVADRERFAFICSAGMNGTVAEAASDGCSDPLSGSSKMPLVAGSMPDLRSASARLVSCWKLRMNLPMLRAISGSLFGPKTSKATNRISVTSMGPTLNTLPSLLAGACRRGDRARSLPAGPRA